MNQSQLYIGTQNGVVVCINDVCRQNISGIFYHSYSREGSVFTDLGQLLFSMEKLFNELSFPYPSTNERHFPGADSTCAPEPAKTGASKNAKQYTGPMKREKIMKDEELLMKHGDLGSFIIRVQHRQNSSWQGRITWVEKNQTLYFRSVWEMMKLIENAISTVAPDENEGPDPVWETMSEPS